MENDSLYMNIDKRGKCFVIIYYLIYLFGFNVIKYMFREVEGIYLQTILFGIMYILTWIIMYRFILTAFKRIGHKLKVNLHFIIITFGIIIILYTVTIMGVSVGLGVENANQSSLDELARIDRVAFFFFAVIFGPFVEEFVFRGFIFSFFKQRFFLSAHLFTAIIFGFHHIWIEVLINQQYSQVFFALPYMVMSLGLSIAYEKTKNIFIPILMHMSINFIAFL